MSGNSIRRVNRINRAEDEYDLYMALNNVLPNMSYEVRPKLFSTHGDNTTTANVIKLKLGEATIAGTLEEMKLYLIEYYKRFIANTNDDEKQND